MKTLKSGVRVLGIAESFVQGAKKSVLAGVVMRRDLIIDGAAFGYSTIGGMDATGTILEILNSFHGIVVLDEAYIDFATKESYSIQLDKFPNLIILQTFSKAWGSAAIRLGMAFASKEIISVFNKIKYPYNVNVLTQEKALETLKNEKEVEKWVETTLAERKKMIDELEKLKNVQHIYPTDANFVLVKVDDANATYKYLVEKGIIVRNRNSVSLCLGCLRITIGTKGENETLLRELQNFSQLS